MDKAVQQFKRGPFFVGQTFGHRPKKSITRESSVSGGRESRDNRRSFFVMYFDGSVMYCKEFFFFEGEEGVY